METQNRVTTLEFVRRFVTDVCSGYMDRFHLSSEQWIDEWVDEFTQVADSMDVPDIYRRIGRLRLMAIYHLVRNKKNAIVEEIMNSQGIS